ncbi:hypothetical protein [Salinimicrobium xinjiangense]|uniref:hypothetical protein n=1 Tax=Salinimicrobium xinjiangense TaxID=438596 RepID=UPI0003FB37CB|nr:hypothetical protein [Salinimicrobium xinjiangense]
MEINYNKGNQLSIKSSFRILSFIFAAILISACSKKVTFPVSEVVPAAEAVVKIDKDSNKNYEIELEVSNLAEAERLTPARKHYVVWLVTKKHGTINIGNLNVSRKNNAKITTGTPYEPIRIFVTAEDDPSPVLPSTQVVLNSGEFKV